MSSPQRQLGRSAARSAPRRRRPIRSQGYNVADRRRIRIARGRVNRLRSRAAAADRLRELVRASRSRRSCGPDPASKPPGDQMTRPDHIRAHASASRLAPKQKCFGPCAQWPLLDWTTRSPQHFIYRWASGQSVPRRLSAFCYLNQQLAKKSQIRFDLFRAIISFLEPAGRAYRQIAECPQYRQLSVADELSVDKNRYNKSRVSGRACGLASRQTRTRGASLQGSAARRTEAPWCA